MYFATTIDLPTFDSINEKPCDVNTLSYRLKYAMKFFSINQSELARRIGIKPQIIQYLCTKNIYSSKFTYEIADALGVNYSWLAAGELPMISAEVKENCKIPYIAWESLEDYIETNPSLKISNYIFANISNDQGCFGITLNDNSLEPRISNGTILIFDQNRVATNNDFVLVELGKTDQFIVRQLSIVENTKYLLPINTKIFKTITLENQYTIIAVMIQTIQNF